LYFNRNKNTINVGFDTKEKGLKILKGKVVDQNGEAVIGASIQVKGTTAGVITDINGNYELTNVPINAQIAISYIGYQTIILNANSKKLALVTLREDTELLDEVVVVGYGTMKKKDLLGATSMVSGDRKACAGSFAGSSCTHIRPHCGGKGRGVLLYLCRNAGRTAGCRGGACAFQPGAGCGFAGKYRRAVSARRLPGAVRQNSE
jgi:hypothetical protein